ncbi:hypothetical protein [Planococcus salinarum]|uniref:hypothetical protein n=1 Tax=Planococcus salinarum TaxID=622695 RepID=UPI000E3E042D|nr:hypothetical protein [Planococcus salinarum]TAA73136.1 hypothetical protein D2909_02140 [Planococcus salinarum]
MPTLEKYRPTGSKEVDKILEDAFGKIQASNDVRNKIKNEINNLNKKKSIVSYVIEQIFK